MFYAIKLIAKKVWSLFIFDNGEQGIVLTEIEVREIDLRQFHCKLRRWPDGARKNVSSKRLTNSAGSTVN